MNKSLFLLFIFIGFFLQSCLPVIHSHYPFKCFAKKCRQMRSDERHLASKVNKSRIKKLKSTRGERTKTKVMHKEETTSVYSSIINKIKAKIQFNIM